MRRTTTKQINTAITSGLLQIKKAECHYKSSSRIDEISTGQFKDSLEFLCETIFANCLGWHYELNHKTGNYEIECSRMDGSSETIIAVFLKACENISDEDIEKALLFLEG